MMTPTLTAGMQNPRSERHPRIPNPVRTAIALATSLVVAHGAPLRAQAPPQPVAPPVPQAEPAGPQGAPPGAPPAAPQEAPPAAEAKAFRTTPLRLSFVNGEVSFWRPGADDWAPAQLNTPLAPGDALYAGDAATLELQIGARAFVRAGAGTQVELDNQEPDFLQFKVPSGHASVDLRTAKAGQTIEIDTPNAAFTIEGSGYYRVDITDDTTTFITRRGGHALATPAGGEAESIAPSEEVVVQGADKPTLETYAAPELDAWDRWNYDRTDHLIDAVSARYVPQGVYGVDELDHHGSWRVTPDYGPVWIPQVAPGWAPYSNGRWVWDPYYGWTWLDDAPWGWAPCHYGRWVHVSGFWGWAPGPLIAAPVYSPALVAFFGGPHFGVSIGIGAPAVGWVALGWGEPVVPWWGRPGFVGVPWWGGWGGPHVVNNVVVERTTVVNVNNITVYQNMRQRNAVVAVREDRFGRFGAEHVRVGEFDAHQAEPVRGRLPVQPVAASLRPREGHAATPPQNVLTRSVVATRAPHDSAASLRAAGLPAGNKPAPAPHLVSAPHAPRVPYAASRPPFGRQGDTERARPPEPPRFGAQPPAQQRQPAAHGVPPERARIPGQPSAPAASAPPAHPPAVHGQHIPPPPRAPHEVPRQPVPREAAPRPPAPREPAAREAAPQEPAPHPAARPAPPANRPPAAPPEGHAPAPPRERSLPGEPANRLYRGYPQAPPAHAGAPHAPPPHAGAPRPSTGDRESAPAEQHKNGR